MIARLTDLFVAVQSWLFAHVVQGPMLACGLAGYLETGFDGVEILLFGLLELTLAYLLLRPLEALCPAEDWPDRRAVRVDVLYTLLNRTGVIPLAIFLLLAPPFIGVDGWLRRHDILPQQLEDWLPALDTHPLISFLTYLLLLDFAEYWRHRLSHQLRAWWALHSIHHSQRQMSFWADSRNHLLDDLLSGLWLASLSLLIGVPPGQFVGLLVLTRLVESFSHANTRLGPGRLMERLIVGPRYHRWHHALALPAGQAYRLGCNFARLFPVWDWLFRTQYLGKGFPATGIDERDARETAARDRYWAQQRMGLIRLRAALGLHDTAGTSR